MNRSESRTGAITATSPKPGDAVRTQTPDGKNDTASPNDSAQNPPHSNKKNVIVVVAGGIIAALLAAIVLMVIISQNQKNNSGGAIAGDVGTASGDQNLNVGGDASSDGSVKAYVVPENEIRQYAQTECLIPENSPLYADKNIRTAADNCRKGSYEAAFKALSATNHKYDRQVQFDEMMMLNAYAAKQYEAAVDQLVALIDADAAAVCDPAVRNMTYSLIENDILYKKLRSGIKKLNPMNTSESLAWLLLLTPCNQFQRRFDRLAEFFDAVKEVEEETEEMIEAGWLEDALWVWRPFRLKGACQLRQKRLDPII